MPDFPVSIDPYTFVIGFITASIFWWLVARGKPLWLEVRKNINERRQSVQLRTAGSIEQNFRRITYRRAQAMHLAASLFPLDEILLEPLLLAPPPSVLPGTPPVPEDTISQTIPYLPSWPELAAVYRAAALTAPQALSAGSNLVLIGQPGIGKTVALAHLASLAANQDDRLGNLKDFIPYIFHVADLKLPITDAKDVLKPIIEAASEQMSLFDLARLPSFVQGSFKNGHALLLLDGFDELTSDGQLVVSQYLKQVMQTYPKTRLVTTGAPEYLDGLIALGFAPLSLLAWTERRCRQFIQRWSELWSRSVALEILAQSAQVQIDPLLLNTWLAPASNFLSPLEITLKTWGAYAGDCLGPNTLDAIASHLRRIAPSGTPPAALETLAMQVVLSADPIFEPRNARQWVRAFETPEEKSELESEVLPSADIDLEDTAPPGGKRSKKILPKASTGLLGRMAASGLLTTSTSNRMRFLHPLFFGYLAGRALSTYQGNDAILNQPDWSGKYLAMKYLAAHGDVGSIVEKLLDWSRLPMHRPLLSAARWLRDAPHDVPWCGRIYSALASLLQSEGAPLGLRGQAVAAFVVSGDPGVCALFRHLPETFSYEGAQLSALGSGALKDVRAIPILESILKSPDISARRAACMALVAIGNNEALEIVAGILLNADEDLRRVAAESLANDPGEGHAMLKDGVTLKDILLRRAAVYGLARVEEPWADELLQKLQLDDDQWVVRNSAAEGLEIRMNAGLRAPRRLKPPSESPWLIEFAGKQGVGISPTKPATEILLQALRDDDPDTRLAALPYLKYTPTEGVLGQMYNAMYADDQELREVVYQTLWEIGASGVKLPHPSQYGLN